MLQFHFDLTDALVLLLTTALTTGILWLEARGSARPTTSRQPDESRRQQVTKRPLILVAIRTGGAESEPQVCKEKLAF